MVAQRSGLTDRTTHSVILRHATDGDCDSLESFDVGDGIEPWLREVREIVPGLLAWRSDPDAVNEDRQVIIAEDRGQILAVAAHVRLVNSEGMSLPENRYLMVTAVRSDRRRHGLAQHLVESVLVDLAHHGVRTVEWLDHPSNLGSIAFSRSAFPEADETHPPEDKPYVSFALGL